MSIPALSDPQVPLRVLLGPTASGKSELGARVAERAGLEVLSLDSMLVYRGMDIGTAKPGSDLRARAPHHLLDLVEPNEVYSVQRYVSDAQRALAEVQRHGRGALLVGGTALYLKALTHGLFQGPDVDPALRADLERRVAELGPEAAHAEVARIDAPSAARIHPRDSKRLVRALEVHAQTGRALSQWQQEWSAGPARPLRLVGLAPPAAVLEERIRARTARMLDQGWVEEALAIRAGPGFSATAIQALGYTQVLALADGLLERADCAAEIALRTRQFARRQRTWFRSFKEIRWVPLTEASSGAALEQAAEDVLAALFA